MLLSACDEPAAAPAPLVQRTTLDEIVILGAAPDPSGDAPPLEPNNDIILRGHLLPRARDCWDAALTGDPIGPGKIVLALTVAPTGEVTAVHIVQNAGVPDKATSCITNIARGTVFNPIGANGTTVTVPMTLGMRTGREDEKPTEALRASVETLRGCYKAALEKGPFVGLATYYVDTDATGAVSNMSANPTESLPMPLLQCVANAVKATKLPPRLALEIPIRFVTARAQRNVEP
jgi:hypothetical protein